jgi:DNA polymerase-3 subunit delta'
MHSQTTNDTNWTLIGHEWAVDFLRRSRAGQRAAHAYLISGPAGIGKALLALRIAQVHNCDQGGPDPCLTCRSCKRIERGNHPDVRIAGMASQAALVKAEEAARQKDLKIDTIRTWQGDLHLRPFEGQRRVFVLHDAEKLNEAAANAMLKTLEEPPPYVTLVLVANTSGDLLPTIVSRCQPLKLRPIPRQQIATALRERHNLATEDADLLAAWSGGRYGWCVQMINDPERLEAQRTLLDDLIQLGNAGRTQGFRWAEEQAKLWRNGEQEQVFGTLELWQSYWRDLLLSASGCENQMIHIDRRATIQQTAQRLPLVQIHQFAVRISSTAQQLRENVNPQLALENLLLHVPV